MIVELGHFVLALALVVSLIGATVPLWGVLRGKKGWISLALPAARALFILVSLSFLALVYAYTTSDFSVRNVVENSHSMMPLIYKIAASWGNHEGSMLLWVWVLAFWGMLASFFSKKMSVEFTARALSIQSMIAFGFILFVLLTSNPFARLLPPVEEGMGLNPVLQDLGLAAHPPLLYMGYVGFSIAFCFAMAALLEKKVDAEFARFLRPWVLGAWAALTGGIVNGSLWAYYELGWGGFWFWDPVENASLMPWLCGTALLHSLNVLEKRNGLASWTVFLSVLSFSFSLLGTFLVRSGILTSVHAFATDPTRGIFILILLTVAIGGAFLLYALRAPSLRAGAGFSLFSRETFLLLNNVFLFTFCATVFMGTLYPVFLAALDAGEVSVGPPYYKMTMLPLFVVFSLLLGIAHSVAWQKDVFLRVIKKQVLPLMLTVLVLGMAVASFPAAPLLVLGFGLGGWILMTALSDALKKTAYGRRWRGVTLSYYGMVLAHAGFAVLVLGVTATTQAAVEKTLWMQPGDEVKIGSTITFLGIHQGLGPDYNSDTGIFRREDGVFITPEKRWYPVAQQLLSEVDLVPSGLGFLYVVLGDQDSENPERWVVRLYHHPLVLFIFIGGFMISAGGILSILDRKRARA